MEKFIKTSSITRRLMSISALAILLLLLQLLTVSTFMNEFVRGFVGAYRTQNYLQEITRIQDDLRSNAETLNTILSPHVDASELRKSFDRQYLKLEEELNSLQQMFQKDPVLDREFNSIIILRRQTRDVRLKLFDLVEQGIKTQEQKEQARTYLLTHRQFRIETLESLSRIFLILRARFDRTFETLYASKNQPLYVALSFALVAGLFFSLFAFQLVRRINRSLQNLESYAEKVGGGLLEAKADILYRDELGQLTDRFNRMTENLKSITVSKNTLEEKNQELEQFSYVASHDLQEPLRKIIAYGEVLMEDYASKLDAEGKEDIQVMQSAAMRMQTLIESLLVYSRVGRSEESFTKVDLNGLVKDVCGDLEVAIRDSNARIECRNLPVIYGAPVQMRQLFQNLIGNALKFVKKGTEPHIVIESRSLNQKLTEIRVVDNGIGFESKYVERIFMPFRRLHGQSEYKGTGIGLAICKKIVERHGGHITAESLPGRGTSFIIKLPM